MNGIQHYKPHRQSVDGSEGEKDELLHDAPPFSTSTSRSTMGTLLLGIQTPVTTLKDILILALAIAALATYAWRPTGNGHSDQATAMHAYSPPGALPGCNCGSSIREAMELSCKYDTLASAWLPPHCRDPELTALFDKAGDGPNGTWTYWLDREKTTEISVEEISALADTPDTVFYNSHIWHVVHCQFYWRKAVRALRLGTTVEPRYSSERHAIHCAKMMALDGSQYMTATRVALNSNFG